MEIGDTYILFFIFILANINIEFLKVYVINGV